MTGENKINDLLSFADKVMSDARNQRFLSPPRQLIYHSYLSEFEPKPVHIEYFEELPPSSLIGVTQIIHGHPVGIRCFASYFCHEFGFWPNKTYSPHFKKQFEMKWKEIYGMAIT